MEGCGSSCGAFVTEEVEQRSAEAPAPPVRGFSGYRPDLEDAIFRFQREEYPHRLVDTIASNWRWLLVASAARLGIRPLVWLYLKNGAVVAHQGGLPVRVKAGADELTAGWFVETMAAQSVRGSPIGPMLVKKALEDLPLNLSLGQTAQMRELQFALGWREVCVLANYLLVCGYRMNLRHKLPPLVAETTAFVLGLHGALVRLWRRRAMNPHLTFRRIERFGHEHDELWRRMAATCECAVVRDASYLNWKYVDRPFAQFTCIEMRDGGVLTGVVVICAREPTNIYPYRRGSLVDLVVPLDREEYVAALLAAAVDGLRVAGAQTVTCHVASAPVGVALARFGFIERAPRFHFLVATGGASEALTAVLTGAYSWFLTSGDSDADAYAW